jgi:hypothetical protein
VEGMLNSLSDVIVPESDLSILSEKGTFVLHL